MKNGDISNVVSSAIAFRVDDSLLKIPKASFLSFLRDKPQFNKKVKDAVEYIYKRTPYTVKLIILNKYYSDDIKEILEKSCPYYGEIIQIFQEEDIRLMLRTNSIQLYIDENKTRVLKVHSVYAMDCERLKYVI